MPLAKIGTKHQVVIPMSVFTQLGLAPGDYVEIAVERRRAILKPKKMVDIEDEEPLSEATKSALEMAIAQADAGKSYGPFDSAEDLIEDMHRRSGKQK